MIQGQGAATLPKVVYWTTEPSPYFVDRYNALADRGEIEFEAWFNQRRSSDRSWTVDESTWRFTGRYLPTRTSRFGALASGTSALDRFRPDLLVTLYGDPSCMLGWSEATARGIRTGLRILPPSETWFGRSRSKELIKRALCRNSDALLVSGDQARDYVRAFGVPDDRIFEHPQVVDTARFAAVASPDRRSRVRAELGLTGTVLICVGRLWWGKGLDGLLCAVGEQLHKGRDLTLILVGDGPDEPRLREMAAALTHPVVHFAGFKEGDDLLDLMAAADVFVFPTLGDPYGLVVDEAMAAGLPVVSSDAAGEIRSRVIEGRTGYVYRSGSVPALSSTLDKILAHPTALPEMGAAARQAMCGRDPSFSAEKFVEAIGAIITRPKMRRFSLLS